MSKVNKIELPLDINDSVDVMNIIEILTKSGYHCKISRDEFGYVITYDWEDEELASNYLYWLTLQEATMIDDNRNK
jgi:hypothetical protein